MICDSASTIPVAFAAAAFGLYHSSGAGLTPCWDPSGSGKYTGTPLVVYGGAGSVGQMGTSLVRIPCCRSGFPPFTVIQLAKLSGFSPIIAVASPSNSERLISLGATHVHPRDAPLTPVAVSALTSSPITLVFDAMGMQETQQAGYELLAPGGKVITVAPDAVDRSQTAEQSRVVSFILGSSHPPPNRQFGEEMCKALTELLAAGLVKVCLPPIVFVFVGCFIACVFSRTRSKCCLMVCRASRMA
jgi:NADPH:quinone reductase-like Zn-dependent oxidoreductase